MADCNRKGLSLQEREGPSRRRHYSPRTISLVPGVTKTEYQNHQTGYAGTMQALVASGLAAEDMFPGQPGRPVTSASYRALGAPVRPEGAWDGGSWSVPGHMTIFRKVDGTFRIDLTVSYEEQATRKAVNERVREREGHQDASAEEQKRRHLAQRRDHLQLACSLPSNVVFLHRSLAPQASPRDRQPSKTAEVHPLFVQRRQAVACEEVVAELELLLRHARKGRISGFAWAGSMPKGCGADGDRFAADTAGEAARDRHFGSRMALDLFKKAEALRNRDDRAMVAPTHPGV